MAHPGAIVPQKVTAAPVRSVAVRKVASKAAAIALTEKHTLTAVGAGAALGLAERNNIPLPYVGFLGRAGTYGVAIWALGRYTGNQMAQHAASGLLAVAAYELAKGGGSPGAAPSVSGDETIMGEV